MTVAVDSDALTRRLDELALVSDLPPPAVTRVLFSESDLRGRDFVRQCAREAGLSIREDAIGNIFLRWEGSDSALPAVATGSCRNGWSHRPEEYASPDHIATGVTVLAHTMARLAG